MPLKSYSYCALVWLARHDRGGPIDWSTRADHPNTWKYKIIIWALKKDYSVDHIGKYNNLFNQISIKTKLINNQLTLQTEDKSWQTWIFWIFLQYHWSSSPPSHRQAFGLWPWDVAYHLNVFGFWSPSAISKPSIILKLLHTLIEKKKQTLFNVFGFSYITHMLLTCCKIWKRHRSSVDVGQVVCTAFMRAGVLSVIRSLVPLNHRMH